jgi:hypothetical protein
MVSSREMMHPRVRLPTISPPTRPSWYCEYPFTLEVIVIIITFRVHTVSDSGEKKRMEDAMEGSIKARVCCVVRGEEGRRAKRRPHRLREIVWPSFSTTYVATCSKEYSPSNRAQKGSKMIKTFRCRLPSWK